MIKKIAIIGLGFVGLSLAVALASKGYRILGIDSNKDKISKIRGGVPTFYEPRLSSFLQKALKKTSFQISSKIEKAVNDCDVIFITVGTPLSNKNKIDLRYIKSVVKEIGKCLRNSTNQPLIVVKSTVIPNTTKKIILPILEINSKKKDGEGFTIVTNPEFLREGKAIEDTIKPHVIIIGGEKSNSINTLKKLYQSFYKKNIPYVITNFETAEMIKYANNSFLATKISFINQIAMICQSIPNTNVDDVARAIGMDPRIGNQFLNAGPGYGGSCLPKDLQSFISFSTKRGQEVPLLEAVQTVNDNQVTKIVALIKKIFGNLKGKKITILGLSFKEDSDDIRYSASFKLINLLMKEKI